LNKNVLFICSQNKLRSPTAEQIYARRDDISVLSAGTNNDAENRVTGELLEWADTIFVMEKTHANKIRKKFKDHLKDQRIIVLGIPDVYEFMEPSLIDELSRKLARYIGPPINNTQ